MNAEEPPVADGSSLIFFDLLRKAGLRELTAARREIVIDKVYRIDDDGRFVMVVPYDGFRVSFTSINPHRLIGVQYEDFEINPDTYRTELAPARTIAYEAEIEALQKMGLGLGGTMESVIVYNDQGWLNKLRYEDELVRHKMLDVIGDLRLSGIIRGHVDNFSLPNILAGRRIQPELLQAQVNPQRIFAEARAFYRDAVHTARVKQELAAAVSLLGEPGAAGRVAQRILAAAGGRKKLGKLSGDQK